MSIVRPATYSGADQPHHCVTNEEKQIVPPRSGVHPPHRQPDGTHLTENKQHDDSRDQQKVLDAISQVTTGKQPYDLEYK